MHTIALVDDQLKAIFADIPCCDVAHAQNAPSRSSCNYPKTLLLRDDACFSLVHARFIISSGYSLRPPNHASLRVLWRLQKHGDPLVPWNRPELARSGMRRAETTTSEEARDLTKMEDVSEKTARKRDVPAAAKANEANKGEDEWVVVDGYQAKRGYFAEYFDYDKGWV